jgi:hypothetical protein
MWLIYHGQNLISFCLLVLIIMFDYGMFLEGIVYRFLFISTYVYTFVHICRNMRIFIEYTSIYIHTQIYIYIHTYIHTYKHTYIYNVRLWHVSRGDCLQVFIYIYMFTYMYIYMYIYTYIMSDCGMYQEEIVFRYTYTYIYRIIQMNLETRKYIHVIMYYRKKYIIKKEIYRQQIFSFFWYFFQVFKHPDIATSIDFHPLHDRYIKVILFLFYA